MTLKRVILAWASVNAQDPRLNLGGSGGSGLKLPGSGGSGIKLPGSSGSGIKLPGSGGSGIKLPGSGGSGIRLPGSSGTGIKLPGSGGSGIKLPGSGGSGIQLPGSGGSDRPAVNGEVLNGDDPFQPARTPASRETTTETPVIEDYTTDKTDFEEPIDTTTVLVNEGQNLKSPNPTQPTNPEWEMKENKSNLENWETIGDTNEDWKEVTSGDTTMDDMKDFLEGLGRPNKHDYDGYEREDLKSVGMMDPKYKEMKKTYDMHEHVMQSKKKDMTAIEKSIGDLEEKMMMQAFEFGFGFVLHNMNIIMEQIEPAVLRFNSMLQSVLSLTTIEEGNLAAHPMVSLIRERTTDIVNATSHLFYYMEGENDHGAQDFVNTMMEICTELKNTTNDYETFPMMKMIVDMLPGGYDASRESSAEFILSVAEHYKMWFKWENLYEEMMGAYKKMGSMKDKMYGSDDPDYGYDGEYGYNHDGHNEMKETYPPMPNTPLGQLFQDNIKDQKGQYGDGRRPEKNGRRPVMEMVQSAMSMMGENDTENTISKVVYELMEMFDGIDMGSILPMVTRLVQNNVNMDFSKILEMAQMFM